MTSRFRLFAVFFAMAAFAPAAISAADLGSIPPVASTLARIWIYRLVDPYENTDVSFVRLNGRIAGTPYQGSAFYRDVSPGTYQISVDSQSVGPNPSVSVTLQPGQVVYADVAVSMSMGQEFAITLAPPDAGQDAIAESHFAGGRVLGM